ncbi:hypothetical protein SBDP1_660010 [Syntrophobacter sp. SbD1]|nr:hypothetical protein SBDP1_660010 [Syntrophobacter sp. SbD1]
MFSNIGVASVCVYGRRSRDKEIAGLIQVRTTFCIYIFFAWLFGSGLDSFSRKQRIAGR